MKKVVAIVGRPNVGKSTLFNRMVGKRVAIVHHTSGVTRDRNYGEVEWTGKKFFLIDTGGFVPDTEVEFNKQIREQIIIALEEADKVLFIVDAASGLHPIDSEIIKVLRKYSGKREIIVAVNKCDDNKKDLNASEFYKLGITELFPISALSGRNVAELLDYIVRDEPMFEEEIIEDTRIKLAVIGRPNAGKSSIVNSILKEDRNIVTNIPGTTRDSIDSIVKYHGEEILMIDTAGLVKKSKLNKSGSVEFFSTVRTYRSIQRCDVAILVIDASMIMESLSESSKPEDSVFRLDKQDIRIIEDVFEYKKGLVIAINKWDLIEKDSMTSKLFERKITEHLKSFDFLSFIFISALTKQRIHKVLEEATNVYNERRKEIKTSELNEKILAEIKLLPPPSANGKEIKLNYITQVGTAPPVISFFTNEPRGVPENYKKYLERKIRHHFGFRGVPLTLVFKKKN